MLNPTEDYPFNWDVETKPIYDEMGAKIDGYHEIIRTDSQNTLHVATERYVPITNKDFMNTVDTLVRDYDCNIIKAGSFKDGREVFVQMDNNDFVNDLIPGDKQGEVKGYVTLANSHNGGLAFRFFAGMIRIWCQNTWTVATKLKHMDTIMSIKHTLSGPERVHAFAENISDMAYMQRHCVEKIKEIAEGNRYGSVDTFAKNLWQLKEKPRPYIATQQDGTKIKAWTAPKISSRGTNLIDKLNHCYDRYKEINHGNWRMFNAVTDFVDHESSAKRLENGYAMFGSGNVLKLRAYNLLFN